ncbi:MBL fold metallo-hydrolase, partial [Clostridioides difficile]|uniref:MBL fold metallo-hydrolase n=1 Tax=Clostridioides difficile TaxID=1496 RepID=UPI002FE691B8
MRNKIFLSILIIISLLIGCDKKSLLSIHMIDVGQGDSILVQTPTNKNILIDGGDEDSENIIISYLRQKRIKTIDIIIATHPDSDHIGSLDNIIKKFNVNSIYMPEQSTDSEAYQNLINSCTDKNLSIQHLYKNDVLNIDNNINIYVLSPSYIQEESKECQREPALHRRKSKCFWLSCRWRACISYTASRRSAGGCGVPA